MRAAAKHENTTGRVRNGDRAVWGAPFFCEPTAAEEAERYLLARPRGRSGGLSDQNGFQVGLSVNLR
jgi:hypothetical protein